MKSWLALALSVCISSTAMAQTALPGDSYWPGQSTQSTPASSNALAVPQGSTLPGDSYWPGQQGNTGSVSSAEAAYGGATRTAIPSSVNGVMADQVFNATKNADTSIPWVRATVIQEAAAAYGAQAGMAARAQQLNEAAQGRSGSYDRVFNFAAVMLEPGFLPPVISEGRDAYNQPNDNEVRASDRIYKIEFAARLVNTPPRWQQYLTVPVSAPLAPDRTALPKNSAEKALWNEWAQKGWTQGASQADQAFESNLARLRRDFEGMLRYKMLYQQGVVSKPILSRSNLGVTGGGDEMAINDRIYRITNKAQLNPDSAKWSQPMPSTHQTDPVQTQPVQTPKSKSGSGR